MATANTRAEVIAALITDRFSGFKEGDEANLESYSDQRLEEFRGAADARKTAAQATVRLETDNRNLAARLKVAEDRIRESEQEMSEDEFLQRAPQSIKALVEGHRTVEAATKASLVATLKDLGAHTEDELNKMPLEGLKSLASYARVSVPDFSGRGVAVTRNAETRVNYAPPDPYAAGLTALRGGSK